MSDTTYRQPLWIISLLSIWMTLVTIALVWGIFTCWTDPLPSGTTLTEPQPSQTTSTGTTAEGGNTASRESSAKDGEKSLLPLIFLLGAAGAQIHALQSFSDYVGNGQFYARWSFWYMKRPLVGALLAFVAYAVIGGGVMGTSVITGKTVGNLWGLTAICLLTGMFSRLVTDKLYEVFSTLLVVKPQDKVDRKDSLDTPPPVPPSVTHIDPAFVSKTNPVPVRIHGSNFSARNRAIIGNLEMPVGFISATELELNPESLPTDPGNHELIILNPDTGAKSAPPITLEIRV